MTSVVVWIWKKNPKFSTWNRIFFWFCKKNPRIFENSAHLYIVNLIWANFEPNQRNFLAGGIYNSAKAYVSTALPNYDDQGIRRSAAKIERGSYLPDWCPPASLSSIKRGLGTERARLGTLEPLPQNVQD